MEVIKVLFEFMSMQGSFSMFFCYGRMQLLPAHFNFAAATEEHQACGQTLIMS